MGQGNGMSGIGNAGLTSIMCWMLAFALSPLAAFAEEGDAPRIGLIADTQLTTRERTSHYLFRTVRADALANVAVRTAAQEHLAARHLELLLGDLLARRPDVVLYLGDGANSGCDDELDDFFAVLEAARTRSAIPIFYVIGNHDYLATGNQTDRELRSLACGGLAYDTKAELVSRAAEFNRASWQSFAKGKGLFTSYDDSLDAVTAIGAGCREVEEDQDVENCFYSAVLGYERGGRRGAFVLLDTSDYRDLHQLPALSRLGPLVDLRGTRGGISYLPGGQNAWIKTHLPAGVGIDRLFLASHYPSADLKWLWFRSGRYGDLLIGEQSNLWLSGHTHEPDPASEPMLGRWYEYEDENGKKKRSKSYDEVNVGSTTDHRAHAAIVTLANGVPHKAAVLAMDDDAARVCRAWIADLRLAEDYGYPLPKQQDARTRLGLTKAYRQANYRNSAAKRNIDRLLAGAGAEKETRIRCLMFLAGEAERG